jgi:pimeloyl-ACP methyl ester carboxylesterase
MKGVAQSEGFDLPFVVDGDGSGPALIFAHGLTGQLSHTRATTKPLVDAGWTVVSFDQRGHAAATKVLDAEDYDVDAMGRDLWAVLDAAGIDRCWIGGGSMGCATSFASAKLAPQRVEGLVQGCPALSSVQHELVWLFDMFGDQLRDGGIDGLIATQKKLLADLKAPAESIAQTEELRAHDAASLELAVRAVPRWILPDYPAALGSFDFPVVVVGWDADAIHPLANAEQAAAAAGVDLIKLDFEQVQRDRGLVGRVLLDAIPSVTTTA